jgi:TetR/AcrR family fatty acid metabolism transcriptional regulator
MNDKRKRILEAAQIEFEACGFHEAKISAIAKRADVGKGTVYEYFSSKADLFDEMVAFLISGLAVYVSSELNALEDPVEKLRFIINLDWQITKDHWQLMNVIFTRIAQSTDEHKMMFLKMRERSIRQIENILVEGVQKGLFIEHDSRIVALMIKGSFSQANMDLKLKAMASGQELNDEMFHKQTDHMFELIINNIRKNPF